MPPGMVFLRKSWGRWFGTRPVRVNVARLRLAYRRTGEWLSLITAPKDRLPGLYASKDKWTAWHTRLCQMAFCYHPLCCASKIRGNCACDINSGFRRKGEAQSHVGLEVLAGASEFTWEAPSLEASVRTWVIRKRWAAQTFKRLSETLRAFLPSILTLSKDGAVLMPQLDQGLRSGEARSTRSLKRSVAISSAPSAGAYELKTT